MSIEMNAIECSQEIKQYAKDRCNKVSQTLAIVTVGEDEASKVYVNNKKRELEKYGFKYQHIQLSEHTSFLSFRRVIEGLNQNDNVNGIIIQQPINSFTFSDEQRKLVNTLVEPSKDVDGLHPMSDFAPCTPLGICYLLAYFKVPIQNKNVVIAGRSDLVGKPLAKILMEGYNCTVTIIHSHTAKDTVKSLLNNCDIFVSAIGKPKYWTNEFFTDPQRQKLALVDVGINRDENGKLCGDVDPEVYNKFDYYTPVPRGVGLMTVASLIDNLADTE